LTAAQQAAIAASLRISGFESVAATPVVSVGHVPVVARQWRAAVEDSAITKTWATLAAATRRTAQLLGSEPRQLGAALPNTLTAITEALAAFGRAVEELNWFTPPADDRLGDELAAIGETVSSLRTEIATLLNDASSDGLASHLDAGDAHAAAIEALGGSADDDEIAPWSMLRTLFALPATWDDAPPELDLHALRAATALSQADLDALSLRLSAHLLPAQPQWAPHATGALLGVLLCERPLIAHRGARSTQELLHDSLARDRPSATQALADYKTGGELRVASHKELIAQLAALEAARAAGDPESAALAVARLYAAVAEGPVTRAAELVLGLLGAPLVADVTLATVRDQLATHDEVVVARDLAAAIEPDWRNAVDHRQVFWDAGRQELCLRGDAVDQTEVFRRQAAGYSAAYGVELSIAVAMTGDRPLLDAVERLRPVHSNRVLVEHRVGQNLAAHNAPTQLRSVGRRLVVGPLEREQLVPALGALVSSIDDLRTTEAIELHLTGCQPLLVTPDVLRRARRLRERDERNELWLSADSMLPAFVGGLMALGVEPREALEQVAEKALRSVTVDVEAGKSKRAMARQLARTAARAECVIREARMVCGETSPATVEVLAALRELGQRAQEYSRRPGPVLDAMLAAVERLEQLSEQLPLQALPWFDEPKPETDDQPSAA